MRPPRECVLKPFPELGEDSEARRSTLVRAVLLLLGPRPCYVQRANGGSEGEVLVPTPSIIKGRNAHLKRLITSVSE